MTWWLPSRLMLSTQYIYGRTWFWTETHNNEFREHLFCSTMLGWMCTDVWNYVKGYRIYLISHYDHSICIDFKCKFKMQIFELANPYSLIWKFSQRKHPIHSLDRLMLESPFYVFLFQGNHSLCLIIKTYFSRLVQV